ncbi:MAG: putative lipoprotein [Polaromonas sp.]|nr:putative lipoprotein [Polaromonas sp.]
MKLLKHFKLAAGSLLVAGLAACGGGDGGASVSQSGSLRLALTDAPSCGYDAVNVTIQKVRIHQSSSASDSDGGWSEIVVNPARRVDLLTLTNGVLDELGQTPLPAGKYTQLRLVLAGNDNAQPLANSVKPTGSAEVALKTPSGQQSGVKTNIDLDIAANKMADFVLDFDACKSVVSAGGSGQYLLKPVVTVIPRYVSGVAGFVETGLVNANTSVSLQQGGVVVKASTPDSAGKFLLQPVAPGSYTLVLTAPGRTTAVVTNVAVATDSVTPVNATGTPFILPVSPTGTVNGVAPADTLARVMQPLTTGITVEVAGRFVDAVTGSYAYSLAVNAPRVAPYVPAPNLLVFSADTAAAGKYSVKASLTGFADKTVVLPTLASGATLTSSFTFP